MKTYDLIIENAEVLTMDACGTVMEDGIIGVENGVITLLEKGRPDAASRKRSSPRG